MLRIFDPPCRFSWLHAHALTLLLRRVPPRFFVFILSFSDGDYSEEGEGGKREKAPKAAAAPPNNEWKPATVMHLEDALVKYGAHAADRLIAAD